MSKYQVDALRTIRSIEAAHARAGHAAQAEQMRKVGDQVEALQAENEKLRAIISGATAAVGNGSCCSTQASIEFMAGLPKEIALNSAALLARVARLEELVQTMLDEDPNETIADNGSTVLCAWRYDARRALEEK